MTEHDIIQAGTWVEVTQVVLEADQRPENVPEDTRRTDLLLKVRGFLLEESRVGQQATIRTLSERQLTGRLTDPRPRFHHDFGEPVTELLQVGLEIRRELRALLEREGQGPPLPAQDVEGGVR